MHTASSSSASAKQGGDSSSSCSPFSGWDYEVFLSFRGEDTRTNFTDHLYNALVNRGIHTFRDNEGLQIGETIDPALRSAIRQSKIAIPIFSKDYASSKWCLRELAEIVECMKQEGQRKITTMPVFYHVDPSDVRHQIGCYKKAFRKHEKKYGKEAEGWKKALKEVADLKGWDLKNVANGHEGELIKLIVEEVWSELRNSPLIVTDILVGIDSHIEEMMKLLKIESKDIRIMVGIYGLGGIGKTTISRCVYNAVYHDFDGCSFISDARETFQTKGPIPLQNQLLGNILNLEDPKITSVDHGINMIRQRLPNKRVLIVFDDVDFDLNAIIGKLDWLSSGSRIIITTRDRHILHVFGVDKTYEPSEMNSNQSLQLFSLHAFKRDQPPEDYLDLSNEVVKTTGGLPLALKVIGSSLCGIEESSIWREMTKKLKKIPHHDVLKKLRISYDGLDRVEKEMFLDIACFFIGMDKDMACYIWDGLDLFPEIGIAVLRRKSLVKIDEENKLRMHDQLRDLGREIVCQENPKHPGERSRLWLERDVMDVLNTQTGTRKVEGLCIEFQPTNPPQRLTGEGFAAMTNLKLLRLDYVEFSGNFMYSFSELRWLCLNGCCNIQFTPTNPRNLVVLDLSWGDITESWRGWSYIKVAKNLKVLDLTWSNKLSQTPDLSANLKLEKLILEDCHTLATIDDSIGHLKSLVVLNMKGCMKLTNLPTGICELRSLKILDISNTQIGQLPEELGRLEALTELLIDDTLIEQLPNSIGDLRNLKILSADNCEIREGGIPDDIGRLFSLEILSLNGNYFDSLPATISSLSLLQKLSLDRCNQLQPLPQLSYLINLKGLWLSGIRASGAMTKLPITMNAFAKMERLSITRCDVTEISGLWEMRNLQMLTLEGCRRLAKIESFEGLDSLWMCKIHSCPSLEKFPNLRGLKKLRDLTFIDVGITEIQGLEGLYSLENLSMERCHFLRKIPNIVFLKRLCIDACEDLIEVSIVDRLESLEKVEVYDCGSLKIFPDLSNSTKLQTLAMRDCEELTEIQGVDRLEILKALSIDRCFSIETLPDLSNLKKLESLFVVSCTKLTVIQCSDELESLKTLCINGCISIETLQSLSNLKNMGFLSAGNCTKLTMIQGLDELESLEELFIDGCISIETLPCLSNLKKLEFLSARNCSKLTMIQGLDELESLKGLYIDGCISIETLPCLSNLKKLEFLSVRNCIELTVIQGLLESLEELFIDGCISIETLPCLSNSKKLKSLSARNCTKLIVIQGLDKLESLKGLYIDGCISIETLPCLSNLKKLQSLSARNCTELTMIQGLDELVSLKVLDIDGCISIETLPCLSNLKKLVNLLATNCTKLTVIEGLDKLESLKVLNINGCISIETLPCLSNLKKLECLFAINCTKLTVIQGLDKLESLNILYIDGCILIETLPSLSNLKKLESLSARNCTKLTVIQGLDELESVKLNISGCTSLNLPGPLDQ